jgi:predicted permease
MDTASVAAVLPACHKNHPPQEPPMSELIGLLDLIAPFFGLIGLGFACGKLARRPERGSGLAWMQFFLIYVALPCLFFRLIADKPLDQLAEWRFVAATTASTALAFALAFGIGLYFSRGQVALAVVQGVAGAYSNIGYMGPPLVLAALGAQASAPVALIFIFDSLLLFTLVPLLMAAAGTQQRGALATAGTIAWKVITHPFILATLAGVAAGATHLALPGPLDRMVTWLSQSAGPSALFLLGLTVALRPLGRVPDGVPWLVLVKLVIHPLTVWALLAALGGLAPVWVYAAVTMAALPPALNIFVISTQYDVGVERASACVLIGTLASIVTLTGFLYLIKTGRLPASLFAG